MSSVDDDDVDDTREEDGGDRTFDLNSLNSVSALPSVYWESVSASKRGADGEDDDDNETDGVVS